jgi:hypothetical protein
VVVFFILCILQRRIVRKKTLKAKRNAWSPSKTIAGSGSSKMILGVGIVKEEEEEEEEEEEDDDEDDDGEGDGIWGGRRGSGRDRASRTPLL